VTHQAVTRSFILKETFVTITPVFMSNDTFNSVVGDTLITRVNDSVDVPLRTLYAAQPILLIFFRRFGCQLCRSYALKLSQELHPILKKNNVGFVGVGLERLGLEDFQAGNYFSGDLYIDEGKKAYQLLQLPYLGWVKGIMGIFSRSSLAWNSETKKMGVQGNLKGDGFQLGATYVIGPREGAVWLAHPQKD
jgi:prostamide/prostaglandin F2alpha synthase